MSIPIEVTGIIRSGELAGRYVRVQDDSVNTGGFLILIWWSYPKSIPRSLATTIGWKISPSLSSIGDIKSG